MQNGQILTLKINSLQVYTEMNLKNLLSDKTFLTLVWPHILGCVSQGITVLVLLIAIWGSNNSLTSSLNALQSEREQIVRWSVFLAVLLNIGFLYINWFVIQYYKFAPPIGSVNSKSSLKEISGASDREDIINERFLKYVGPLIIFFIVAIDFIKEYFFGEMGREEALQSAVIFILPFAIGLFLAHLSRIVVEAVILFIRYINQVTR